MKLEGELRTETEDRIQMLTKLVQMSGELRREGRLKHKEFSAVKQCEVRGFIIHIV